MNTGSIGTSVRKRGIGTATPSAGQVMGFMVSHSDIRHTSSFRSSVFAMNASRCRYMSESQSLGTCAFRVKQAVADVANERNVRQPDV